MTMRLGVMGGMFDPVHNAHLKVADIAFGHLQLDRLHLVPCAMPNHRGQPGASQADRLSMLQLAIADRPGWIVDDREFRRGGVSYMVDTLMSFRREFAGAQLVYILGSDSFVSLPGWHRWKEIFELCHLCVVSRPAPGDDTGQATDPDLMREIAGRKVGSVSALFSTPVGNIYDINELALVHSSTRVRELLLAGRLPDMELPPAVLSYIKQHGLYTEPG